jgi:hypothetical protein
MSILDWLRNPRPADSSELGFSHAEYVAARMAYSDKRMVFRQDRE